MTIYEFGDEQIVIDQITDTSCTVNHIEDSWQDLKAFRDQVEEVLGSPDNVLAQIKELAEIKAKIAFGAIDISDVNVRISGGEPSKIAEAMQKVAEKPSQEPLTNEQIIIADLRHDLLVAQKVIARLVGE